MVYSFSGTYDGVTNPTITIHVDYNDAGNLWVNVTSGGAKANTQVGLYVDWSINPSGFGDTDGGNDGLGVDVRASCGAPSQQHLEGDAVAGKQSQMHFPAMESNANLYGSFEPGVDSSASYSTYAYFNKCTSCSDQSDSQYTNGPWDFVNSETMWNADVHFAAVRARSTVTGDFQANFRITAS